jgi:DNA-directed RNA polymerase subunit RPC12/RpoP
MARNRQTIGTCTRCSQGILNCSYNLFEKDALTIHSWEHRCADCGHRVTQAFRSDQTAAEATSDPTVCPFCGRKAVA